MPKSKKKEPATPKPKSKKIGRPTKRTPENRETIMQMVRLGYGLQTAADACGMGLRTVMDWQADDEQFSHDIKVQRGKGRTFYAGKLMEAARGGNLTAMIFWLKTRTTEFREKVTVESDDKDFADSMKGFIESAGARCPGLVTMESNVTGKNRN